MYVFWLSLTIIDKTDKWPRRWRKYMIHHIGIQCPSSASYYIFYFLYCTVNVFYIHQFINYICASYIDSLQFGGTNSLFYTFITVKLIFTSNNSIIAGGDGSVINTVSSGQNSSRADDRAAASMVPASAARQSLQRDLIWMWIFYVIITTNDSTGSTSFIITMIPYMTVSG